jgi:deoxycytidine triphosphate deaminase
VFMDYPTHGAFSQDDLTSLVSAGRIETLSGFQEKHIGPASIDITVAKGEAYRVDRLMRPSGKRKERIRDMLSALGATPITLGSVLEPGSKYMALATVHPNFPVGIYGYTNAKSTSGRNMCLSRTLADGVEGYDTLDRRSENWNGEMWLTLEPLVFPIYLTDQECYSQIRMFDGNTKFKESDLRKELLRQDLLYRQDGSRYKQGELSLMSNDGSVFTTLFAKAGKLVGFRARKTRKTLDLTARGLDPREYFEPVYAEIDPSYSIGGLITLEPGWYYLLSTNETLHVPKHLCAELVAVHPRFGLFFSHFAGFFDPDFKGVPTLEVTCLIPTTIRHREAVGCFQYECMRSETISYTVTGNYSNQKRTTLPKQFDMPEEWRMAMA